MIEFAGASSLATCACFYLSHQLEPAKQANLLSPFILSSEDDLRRDSPRYTCYHPVGMV